MLPETPQDQYISVNQINTRYWKVGKEGTIVVLIHGIGGSVEDWLFNVGPLAEHHRVYALDLPGYGHSGKPKAPYSFSYHAQFVRDFLEALGLDRANLIGHSMGGGVALEMAIRFPVKVERLVLADSAGLGKEVNQLFRLVSLPIVGELLTRPSRSGTAQFLEECVYDPDIITEELIEHSYEMSVLPGAQRAFLANVRNSVNLRGMRDDSIRPILDNLSTITVPVLVIWGQHDRLLPVDYADVAEKGIPDVRVQIFDRCGHVPQFECADEFNIQVLEFLAN